jgi:type IV secretory pathway VirB10-like protein
MAKEWLPDENAGAMARKLKTFTTSAGFFDLAVAAPSMKAAVEAWGARDSVFRHGFAKVSDDPKIIAATMASPGVVLRRAVGTADAFSEQPVLPKSLAGGKARRPPATPPKPAKAVPPRPEDAKAAAAAARAFETERKKRESHHRKEEAVQERAHVRRTRAIAAAEKALEAARREHEATVAALEKNRAALDRKSQAEEARWRKKKDDLEAALRRARTVTWLRTIER